MILLCIETATQICSVSLSRGNQVIGILESEEKNAHSRVLHVMIDRLFRENGITVNDVDAIVVSKGPGSYTGLRIGVSTAKGLCYAADKPLIAINTLEAMAHGMRVKLAKESIKTNHQPLFIPMIDARRMEVFTAIFDADLKETSPTTAQIISEESFSDYRNNYHLILGGDGADKCKTYLLHENITYLDDFKASASYMVAPALDAFKAGHFENVAYFEPFYLKDFIAGKPRVKGLD
jgi:tRNA threonylcarbamoyladenosine biosynthesis protein TsaB